MPHETPRPLVIWRLADGKPGHEKQTLGLARALLRKQGGECLTLGVPSRMASLLQWSMGRFPAGARLPDPDLILGAGHATHLALLAARRARGGKAVVLMKPSLPLCLFDLCVVPAHDAPAARPNVLPIRGVLNDVASRAEKRSGRGLILLGGISAHYGWDDQAVGQAVLAIVRASPEMAWTLTTSRRTPASFLASLSAPPSNLTLAAHEQTGAGWLEQALAEAGQVWVTEDSVSMVYEALTSGAAVGLLRLPEPRDSRVRRGVEGLIGDGWVTPYENWHPGCVLPATTGVFNEAERAADWILAKLSHDQA